MFDVLLIVAGSAAALSQVIRAVLWWRAGDDDIEDVTERLVLTGLMIWMTVTCIGSPWFLAIPIVGLQTLVLLPDRVSDRLISALVRPKIRSAELQEPDGSLPLPLEGPAPGLPPVVQPPDTKRE